MSTHPDTAGFPIRADGLLGRLEASLDRVADALDVDVLRAGNVITLTFESGRRVIVNSQEAAEEIWVAARSGGFHFRWHADATTSNGVWRDTRSNEPLTAAMARLVHEETGVAPLLDF